MKCVRINQLTFKIINAKINMWDVQVEASPLFWHDSSESEGH